MPCKPTVLIQTPEFEKMVGHWTFSMHIAKLSEHSIICVDIMSTRNLEQKLRIVVAYSHN